MFHILKISSESYCLSKSSNPRVSQNHITEINALTLEAVEIELAGHEVATKPFEITIF